MKSIEQIVTKYYEDCDKTRVNGNIEMFQQVCMDFQTDIISLATSEDIRFGEIKDVLQNIKELQEKNKTINDIIPTTRTLVRDSLNYAEMRLKERLKHHSKVESKGTQTITKDILEKAKQWIKHNDVGKPAVEAVSATQMPLKNLTEDAALLDDIIDSLRKLPVTSGYKLDALQNTALRRAVADRIIQRSAIDTSLEPGRDKINVNDLIRENNLLTKWLKTPTKTGKTKGLSALFASMFGGVFEGNTTAWGKLENASKVEHVRPKK
jgi:hypothetical protein